MDTLRIATRIDGVFGGDRWPDEPLWICSVRTGDGRLRVFGRDESEATIGVAVAASSAVPGLLAPVVIDGAEHVDGAVHSPTNADVVAGLGFDRVVVVAPMAGRPDVRQPIRSYHGHLLGREDRRRTGQRQPGGRHPAEPCRVPHDGSPGDGPAGEQAVAEAARRLAPGPSRRRPYPANGK